VGEQLFSSGLRKSRTFEGSEEFMKKHGVEIINLDNNECFNMMQYFIEKNHDLWFEDIGK
jgi:creatinine deaminase